MRLWNVATHQPIGAPLAGRHNAGCERGGVQPGRQAAGQRHADGTVRLWDVATHQAARQPPLPGHSGDLLEAVAFSPDGRLLATGGDDGTVRLWDPATGRAIGAAAHRPTPAAVVYAVAFSPDGKLLATARRRRHCAAVGPGHPAAVGAPLTG